MSDHHGFTQALEAHGVAYGLFHNADTAFGWPAYAAIRFRSRSDGLMDVDFYNTTTSAWERWSEPQEPGFGRMLERYDTEEEAITAAHEALTDNREWYGEEWEWPERSIS